MTPPHPANPGQVSISRQPSHYLLESSLLIPRPLSELSAFFGDPNNLDSLTPPWLNFRILTPQPIDMRVGALIDYQIRIHGIPIRWRTEITAWEPPHRFVDEQLSGPYRLWIHEHTFKEVDGGTLCGDRVAYWPRGGAFAHWLMVRRDILRIFTYRADRLRALFPGPERSPVTFTQSPP